MPTAADISRRIMLSAGIAAAMIGLAVACTGGEPSPTSVQLAEQGGSGQSGTATFASQGSTTRVDIELSSSPAAAQPSHIHRGTCKSPNPQPAFPLADVEDGAATSTVNASLDELQDGGHFYVNVHKSEAEIETVVVCGDIPARGGSDGGGYSGGY